MNPIKWVKGKATASIAEMVKQEVHKKIEMDVLPLIPQFVAFYTSGAQDRQSYYDYTKAPLKNSSFYVELRDRLAEIGVPVEGRDIDISDFENWLEGIPEIRNHFENMGDVYIEKCLEYYLTFRLLKITESDVYIDTAAGGIPWADILNSRGIKSYRLDHAYPAGVHGIKIGADVGDTMLPDGFASVLTLHSAYECFMGDADVRFLKEAARILNDKGRYGIVPLFLEDTYFNATCPEYDQRNLVFDPGARVVWRDDEYKNPFSRHYSPESFAKRIYEQIPDNMIGKVLFFSNLTEVMKRYDGQRIYCFFMFICQMKGN